MRAISVRLTSPTGSRLDSLVALVTRSNFAPALAEGNLRWDVSLPNKCHSFMLDSIPTPRRLLSLGFLSVVLAFAGTCKSASAQTNHVISWKLPTTGADRTIAPGDTVTWVWDDALLHTVTSTTALFDSGTLSGMGTTYQRVFPSPGSFPYFCQIHGVGQMSGTITVQDLPVELTSFSAVVDGADVVITWKTASETNNAGFFIQIEEKPETWNDVAFVEGVGNSISPSSYNYRVKGLAPAPYRFRLKQIDFDGSTEFSEVVEATIEVPGTHFVSAAYPNPLTVQTHFTIHLEIGVAAPQHVEVLIYSVDGRLIDEVYDATMEAGMTTGLTIDGSRWPGGSYAIRIRGERFDDSRLVTVVR